jgi:hypothetical protein
MEFGTDLYTLQVPFPCTFVRFEQNSVQNISLSYYESVTGLVKNRAVKGAFSMADDNIFSQHVTIVS